MRTGAPGWRVPCGRPAGLLHALRAAPLLRRGLSRHARLTALLPCRPPTAVELLRAFAYERGWVAGSGLPDETRAGRRLLKDYVDGKILYCKAPPGASPEVRAMAAAAGKRKRRGVAAQAPAPVPAPAPSETVQQAAVAAQEQQEAEEAGGSGGAEPTQQGTAAAAAAAAAAAEQGAGPSGPGALDLDDGDLLLLEDLDIGGKKKAARPAYKARAGVGGRCGWK